jgi:hypothetical protein
MQRLCSLRRLDFANWKGTGAVPVQVAVPARTCQRKGRLRFKWSYETEAVQLGVSALARRYYQR